MKTKRNKQSAAMALGRKLWGIGVKARVKIDGYDSKPSFSKLSPAQKAAWRAIGEYLLER